MAKGKKQSLSKEELLEQALLPEDEQPYDVPKNWVWTRLKFINVFKSATIDPAKYLDSEFELYSVPSCEYDFPEIVRGEEIGSSKQLVLKNDVLLCKINPRINRVWIVSQHTENTLVASSEWIIIRNHNIDAKYLMWCFQAKYFREYMLSNVSGVGGSLMRAQPKFVQEYPVPLPPLTEQQRIVNRIESLFAKLDQAKELAQNTLDSFETRKSAILHKAFTGELTAKWREEHGVGMDSWGEKTFGELGKFRLGKMLDRVKNKGKLTKYLRNVNVRWFEFDLSDISEMAVTEDEKVVYSIETGDLLICEGGEPGRCAVWKQERCDLIYQKALHRFRTNGSVITSFLAYYILFISKTDKLSQYFTGTTIKHLTGQSLAKISILLPSIPEQEEIVRILDINFEREENANDRCDIIDQINLIKKSILARAFRGELGTNDPSEESAMKLLNEVIVTQ